MITRLRLEPGLWCDEHLPEEMLAESIRQMAALLVTRFPTKDLNCNSPIALGRHCMAISWAKDEILVPPAPPEILSLIKATSPQGRHEILTPPDLEAIPALYEYDLRLAYLWCCKGLPYGEVTTGGDRERRHKVLALWDQPEEWDHIGLLPFRGPGGWIWPIQASGWIDRREEDAARAYKWRVTIADALTWSNDGALDRWSDGIQWALRQVEAEGLIYQMLRRVALWTIGSLHRTTSVRKCSGTAPPMDCPNARVDPGTGTYHWAEEVPITGSQQMYVHPEWTTTIWARCRTRIAAFALQVPRHELIAIRQDALYTSVRQPQFELPRTKVPIGGIRRKWWRDSDLDKNGRMLPAPHSIEALESLRRGE